MQKTLYADYIQSNQEEAPLCLRACEHRPYHLSTHPLCFLGFIIGAYNSMKDLPCSHSEIHFNEVDLRQLTYEEFLLVDRCLNLLNEHKLLDFVGLSCKLSALLSILYSINKRGEKAVIFSQYVGSQDFIFRILEACQIHTVVIRGKDCAERRQRVMELFKNDSEISCLVLSTQIGAHGLDISVANHVILWDSWWNPQVETQAIARCYRRNQCKPVVAYKLVSEYDDAIVLKTQFRKRALFKCVIGGETSQVADESELADCTNTEEDSERRALWIALKSSTAEGGGPTVTKIIRNVDTVRSERWI
uniref:Uncharacterized protein TCIL3000_7_3920 n=1 Tax=Trypanosoma congolense (strain IL3000) TaxID=1068625 RepID=G0UQB7_TRYCI|nr:unnamed protein product [Trypanosoma congolense IL3000]